MSQEVSDVIIALRKKLEDYREKRPNLSIRAIAKRSNVNRYFLSKILSDEESKASSLDFSQVLLLAKFLTASDTLKETIDNSSEEIQNLLLKVFGADYQCDFSASQQINTNPDLDRILDDFDNFIIFLLSTIPGGTKISTVKKCILDRTNYKIKDLIEQDIIYEESDYLIARIGSFPRIGARHLHTHIPEIIRRYYLLEVNTKEKKLIGLFYQNINEETLNELNTLHKEYVKKVNELIDNENNKGDIPVFATVCFDAFTK